MQRQLTRRISKSAKAGQVVAFFSLVLGLVALLAHRIGQIDTLSFLLVGAFAFCLAILAIGLAMFGLMRMWTEGAKAGSAIVRTFVFASLTLSPAAAALGKAFQHPLINDVSTDWTMPPQFPIGSRIDAFPPLAGSKTDNETAQLQAEAYPDLVTQIVTIDPALAEQIVRTVAKGLGWQATTRSGSIASIEGASQAFETRSLIFGFTDDVVVRLRRADNGLLLDVRAKGRAGDTDLGSHAKKIRGFFEAFASEQRKRGI